MSATPDGNTGTTSSSDYSVTPDDISAAAAAATNTANEIADQLAALKGYVQSFEAGWQGIAATAFQSLMNDYDVFAQMLNNALTDIASGLRGNYVNYTDAEQQNISNLQKVNGAIPGANFS
jgi:WXG100 family type VII secretion target